MEFIAYVLSVIALGGVFILWIEIRELKNSLKPKPKKQIKPREPIHVKRPPGYFDKL
jgi:hypothetical protein